MPRLISRFWPRPALAGLFLCLLVQSAQATTTQPTAESRLERTESLRTVNHPQFVRMLQQLHQEAPHLTPGERWHLRYLDGWQAAYQGNYINADALLRDVIDHSGDATLIAKATALLMDNMGVNNRYEEAFTLANQLASNLSGIKDKLARFTVLANLSQLLGSAGQYDQSIRYARMMGDSLPPGESMCNPLSQEVTGLSNSHKLISSSPVLQQALSACIAAGQTVFANTLWLTKTDLYLRENKPNKAIALLRQIAPSIRINDYHYHAESSQALLATAYWKLAEYKKARQAALASIALSSPQEISSPLRDAYDVLYRIAKKRGNTAAALGYYEHYIEQDKGYLNDVSARALAYQVVQQHVLAKKLETEELSKQNSVLRLQQSLDAKAVETSRLYITLLLVVLASIVFWVLRLKRSQLRFKKLSCQDGLTGIFNHQHFVGEADRVLRVLERKVGNACLISIDLDHFKQVNDTHGHAMGDAVLKHTVATCQQHLRPTDLFGRLGGEEFGILLHGCSRDQGKDIADRIRITINATPLEMDGRTVYISASVGLASTDSSGYHLQRLSREADAALYRAKRAGRNRVIADIENDGLIGA